MVLLWDMSCSLCCVTDGIWCLTLTKCVCWGTYFRINFDVKLLHSENWYGPAGEGCMWLHHMLIKVKWSSSSSEGYGLDSTLTFWPVANSWFQLYKGHHLLKEKGIQFYYRSKRCTGECISYQNKLWQYKWTYKLILSHLKMNWSPFPTFSFFMTFRFIFFNNSKKFLSQKKKSKYWATQKIPVSIYLLLMFFWLSESSVSCWKEIIEEVHFCQGTMQIVSF